MASSDFIPADTSPEAHEVQLEAIRKLSIAQRAEILFAMNQRMLDALEGGIRMRHPDYTDDQVRLARIRMQLGDKLFGEVYPAVEIQP